MSSWWSGNGVSCLQVGRSRCREWFRCAGESVELTLVVGVSGVCCSSAPGVLDGGCCIDLVVSPPGRILSLAVGAVVWSPPRFAGVLLGSDVVC